MLYDDPVLYHRGLTIFRDFSDERTFYFLPPEAPRIARSAEGGETGDYALRLVLYRPDPNAALPEGMEDGGGFLNLDSDLHVTEGHLEEVRDEIRRKFGAEANLVPVPFMSGSVELVLLGVTRDEEGQPFVRKVAGSTVPSLYGTQRAAFSVVLDRHGAALMQQVIKEGGMTMALAIYHLTYAGIGPAYNLEIEVDYERVFDHLDLRLNAGVTARSANASFVGKAGFHMLMEELKEKRAIKVTEVDPIPGEGGRTPAKQEEINEIISNLMGSKWFKPTLSTAAQMTNVAGAGGGTTPRPTTTPSRTTPTPTSAGTTPTPTAAGTTPTPTPTAGASAEAEAAERPAATWQEDPPREPATEFPAENTVSHTPAASGNDEVLVLGGSGATAKVGATAGALQPAGNALQGNRLTVAVAPGETRHVEITWPASEGQADAFHLFFDYERPGDNAAEVQSYIAGAPNPAEPIPNRGEQNRFLAESRAKTFRSGNTRGPAALTAWLDGMAPDLTLVAHASFEQDNSGQKRAYNLALSGRRRDVASTLIQSHRRPFTITNATATQRRGHDDARVSAPVLEILPDDNAPANSRNGRPQHRVALIKGNRSGRARSVLRGHLTRGVPPTTPVPPTTTQLPPTTTGTPPTTTGRGGGQPTQIEASFEVNLEMIQREERIKATYSLSSRKARTREVHPQGQLILDVIDPSKYIIEADGAIEFFQWLEIDASTTAQWELDGISAINIDLRYGPLEGGRFKRSGSLQLTPAEESGSWKVGILHENEDGDLPTVYWYEYRVTVHYLADVALGDQQGAVTSVGATGADAEGWVRTTTRKLVIHPRDVTPAVTVNVATGIMHFDLLERAQVALSYGPYRQNLALSAETPEHRLVIRPEPELEDATLKSEGMLYYRDGAQVPLPEREWTAQELIVINEPRENILRVQVILADAADEYEKVQVRLRYEHENRVVENTFELTEHAQIEEWAVRLEDVEQRAWKYQATLIKTGGDVDTIDWTDGEDDRLIVGFEAVDVVPVEVIWLMPPPAGELVAVKVDLEYEDERNRIRWEKSELIREGHTGVFTWAIPIRDPRLRGYRYRVTEYRQDGPREGQWQDSDESKLVLVPTG